MEDGPMAIACVLAALHGVGDHSRNKIDQISSLCIVKPIIVHRA